jgi:hypothetical protein
MTSQPSCCTNPKTTTVNPAAGPETRTGAGQQAGDDTAGRRADESSDHGSPGSEGDTQRQRDGDTRKDHKGGGQMRGEGPWGRMHQSWRSAHAVNGGRPLRPKRSHRLSPDRGESSWRQPRLLARDLASFGCRARNFARRTGGQVRPHATAILPRAAIAREPPRRFRRKIRPDRLHAERGHRDVAGRDADRNEQIGALLPRLGRMRAVRDPVGCREFRSSR